MTCRECESNIEEEGYCTLCDCASTLLTERGRELLAYINMNINV